MKAGWSRVEVEAIVADYFDMLGRELRGESYGKTAHRRALARLLNRRSDGSIERKHQNISAIFIELGYPYIPGYKPLRNYQALLYQVVAERLMTAKWLDKLVADDVGLPAAVPTVADILSRLEAPPEPPSTTYGRVAQRRGTEKSAHPPVDYLAREANNASLGRAGEEFTLNFERARLIRAGKALLADRVEHVAVTLGDCAGFDVLSFEESGRERYIEVKTTAYGKATPFYVTRNEVSMSGTRGEDYHLYRVFNFRRDPRLYSLTGALERTCMLQPIVYMAHVS
ncbi:MAG TPA: DUF3883 domain-containing protein [Patescibacteria group bacterium]|nr:DUF3883 domain-containing protein [Patescibacteria group bacterium]